MTLGIDDALSNIGRYSDSYQWFTWAMIVLGIGFAVYICWNRNRNTGIKAIFAGAGMAALMFNHAKAGDALEQIGRYDTTRGLRDGNRAIGQYINEHPGDVWRFIYNFSDSGSTPRFTAGAFLNSYNTGWPSPSYGGMACGAFGAIGGPSGMAGVASGTTYRVSQD